MPSKALYAGRFFLCSGLTLSILLAPPSALAQDGADDQPETTLEDESDFEFTITPNFRYTFDSELDGPSDKFSVFRGGVDLELRWDASDDTDLVFDFGYEINSYSFETPNTFLATTMDPFSDIHILNAGLTAYFKADDHWTLVGGVRGRIAGESSADVNDAGTFGGVVGAIYGKDDDHKAGVGIYATSQIEDDVLIVPVFQIDWRLDETTRLVGQGTRGEIIWELGESTEVAAGAAWENRRFRLDDDAIHLASVVEDTSVPIFFRLTHRPADNLQIALTGGVIAFQDFEITDRNGNMGRTIDASPTGFVGVDVRFTF